MKASKLDTPRILEQAQEFAETIDLSYLREETPKALAQSKEGIQRISGIVKAMKAFSHPGSGQKKHGRHK